MANAAFIALAAFSVVSGTVWLFLFAGERRRRVLRQRLAGISGASLNAVRERGVSAPRWRFPIRRFFPLPRELQARFDAAMEATGRRITVWHLAGAALFAMALTALLASKLLALHGALVVLLAGAAAVLAPLLLVRFAQHRHQKQFLEIFPDALDLVARAVKAGLPPLEALAVAAQEIAAPVGSELRKTLDEVRIGVDVEEALEHAAARIRVSDFRFFVVTLTLQRRTGGALAETLNNLSTVIRLRKALRRKARALTAEAKTSAIAIGLSPVIAGGALYYHSPSLMMILFDDPRGRFMLGLAVLFLILGFITMVQMIKRALR